MGTRHLIVVVADNDFRVAQYGQWDGNPAGAGRAVLAFLSDSLDKTHFLKKVRQSHFVTEDFVEQKWLECGANEDGSCPLSAEVVFKQKYAQLHRDTSTAVLRMINDSRDGLPLLNNIGFAGAFDCEWVYVIDLDKEILEVYTHTKDPVPATSRFKFLDVDDDKPVNLVAVFHLNDLPPPETFINLLEGDVDDDEE